jgi:lipoyl(octanoyl) transferase
MRQWRLIIDSPQPGPVNMAVDEAILQAVSAGTSLPTLRIYAWEPFCLSIGYGQRIADADTERIAERGWDVVRRPTGGRAILHGDELTYSVALPIDDPLAQGDVVESYRRISEALIAALKHLGMMPESEKQAKGNHSLGPVCFEVPSHYEITVGGKKLIGSAQVRRKQGILQHGTLPLTGDIARICDALAYPDEATRDAAREHVRERAITLQDACGQLIPWDQTAEALANGFIETFDLYLNHESLSNSEQQSAQHFAETLYWTQEWNARR